MIRLTIALLTLAAVSAAPVAAQQKRQDLKATAEKIADEVKKVAEKVGQSSVQMGEFTPVGSRGGDGRTSLELEIRKALGPFVKEKALLELTGTFSYADEPGVEGKVIRIFPSVVNTGSGEVEKIISVSIQYVHDITRFVGPNGSIPPAGTAADARKALEKLQAEPTAAPSREGTRVKPTPTSPYEVEIRVKKDGTKDPAVARNLTVASGSPFVKIVPGEAYEVRVFNHAEQEVALKLSIDGLDQFTFTEDNDKGQPRYSHYILPAAKNGKPGETTIFGWHKKYDDVAGKHRYNEFLVTEYGKSGIVNKPRAKVGMIELAFSEAFSDDPNQKTRARGDAETGRGKEGEVKGTVVVRKINPPTEFVTVRYNREIK